MLKIRKKTCKAKSYRKKLFIKNQIELKKNLENSLNALNYSTKIKKCDLYVALTMFYFTLNISTTTA